MSCGQAQDRQTDWVQCLMQRARGESHNKLLMCLSGGDGLFAVVNAWYTRQGRHESDVAGDVQFAGQLCCHASVW